MNLRDMGFGGIDLIHLAHDRDWRQAVVNKAINHQLA
jgi:hypothetical protein